MSRRSSNEEWERKKSYLTRSLFQDNPQLSDVSEETHSAIDSHSGNRDRSYSPLPELIIEKIPDRHDEPEEYYEQLTVRMRKLYKKLFKIKQDTDYDESNAETVGSKLDTDPDEPWGMTSFSNFEQDSKTETNYGLKDEENETNLNEINTAGEINNTFSIQDQSHTDKDSGTSLDSNAMKTGSGSKEDVDQTKSANVDDHELDKTNSIPSPNATDLISNSTKTDASNEADVSKADSTKTDKGYGEPDNSQSDPDSTDGDNDSPESEEINLQKRKQISYHFNSKTLSTIPEESDQEKDKSNSLVLQINTAVSKTQVHHSNEHDNSSAVTVRASKASILSFEKNEIEVMRGERNTSLDTSLIVHPENNSILNKSFIARDITFQVDDEQEESVESVEFQREIQRCSSPKSNEHNKRLRELSSKSGNSDIEPVTLPRRKRNSNEENFTVLPKRNKRDEGTQTDKNSVTWDTLKRNFFVGVPKVYNLCSCKNHTCNL